MTTGILERDRAGDARGREPERAAMRARGAVLAAILAVCAAIRLVLLASPVGRLDGDEAASGMAAQGILEGRYPLYFPDPYAYFGALEQYLQAPLLLIDPTSPFLLRLPQVALSVASCYLVARLARRCLDHPWAGEIAAALFAVGPFFALAWSFKTRTYAAALFLGLAGLVLALGARRDEPRGLLRAALFGLVCGLAFWTNWTAAFLLLPAGLYWLGAIRGSPPRVLVALAGFVLGALPFAITASQGRLPTIFDRGIRDSSIAERAEALFGSVLGMFVGVRRPPPAGANTAILVEPLPLVVVGAGLVLLLVAVVRRRRGLLALLTLRRGAEPGDTLLLAALLVPPLYVLSSFAFLTEEPRYVFALYGLLPVGLTALVPRRAPAGPAVAAALVGLVALTSVDGIRATLLTDGLAAGTAIARVQSEDLPAVVDALESEGERYVWADYWLGHPLAFVARDRLTVGSWEAPRFYEDYAAVQSAVTPAFAVPVGPPTAELAAALDALGATYRTRQVESVTLFVDVSPTVQPTRLGVRIGDVGLTALPGDV